MELFEPHQEMLVSFVKKLEVMADEVENEEVALTTKESALVHEFPRRRRNKRLRRRHLHQNSIDHQDKRGLKQYWEEMIKVSEHLAQAERSLLAAKHATTEALKCLPD